MPSLPDSGPAGPATAGGGAPEGQGSEHTESGKLRLVQDAGRKKRKQRSKGAKKRGTGFEEYYCDAPMTPAQFEEEQANLYPAHRPFVERIEECIRHFRASRRLDCDRANIFSRYLIVGGVDSTQRQFQGVSGLKDEVLEGRTKAELRDIEGDDMIHRGGAENTDPRFYNPNFPEHWDVDFSSVVAGFLSVSLVEYFSTELYSMGVDVVSNFLKYVDRHDVCPEYAEDIRKAQNICQLALEEEPLVAEVSKRLPGRHNTAASMLFADKDEDRTFELDNTIDFDENLDRNEASTIFGINLAMLLDKEHGQRVGAAMAQQKLTVTEIIKQTFKIVEILFADDQCRARYSTINSHLKDKTVEICGSFTARPVFIQERFDVPAADMVSSGTSRDPLVFFVEESALKFLKVGMILDMRVCIMNEGITFIKSVDRVHPTFYTFLPQELMISYKKPVSSNRLGPKVHDAGGDPNVLDDIPFGDPEEEEAD